jgi:hypothetical protein
MQYYATYNCTYGEAFCRIFLHQLVNAPVKVVRTLPDVLCSSRDSVPLGPKKNTCRQTSLSKWIDWYQFRTPPAPFDSTFKKSILIRKSQKTSYFFLLLSSFMIHRAAVKQDHYRTYLFCYANTVLWCSCCKIHLCVLAPPHSTM